MFIIIYGPTGVGKTEFAQQLAIACNGMMINADMGQLYTRCTIGTAKPDLSNIAVPHCMFNVLDEPIDYTVVQFRDAAIDCMKQCAAQHRVPIVTGGSGFYVSSLLFPPSLLPVTQSSTNQEFELQATDELWQQLYTIDPLRAQQIGKQDRYRIIRALHIWYTSGMLPSSLQPIFGPPDNFGLVVLLRDRADLYHRINTRVQSMFEQGWVDEVQQLRGTPWELFLREKKLVGYTEILDYLAEQKITLRELMDTIAQKTRNYAKRQITFARMLIKKVQPLPQAANSWIKIVNLTTENQHDVIEQIGTKMRQ